MKSLFFLTGVLLILSPIFSQTTKSEWSLAKRQNEVEISYRWIYLNNNTKIRQMKMEFFIDTDINSILKQFTNSSNLKKWQNLAEECEISKSSNNQWNTYMRFDLPWPLKSKDLILTNQLVESEKYTSILMKSMPKSKPIIEDVNRINSLESEWRFTPKKDGKTKVVYTTLTYDKPEFPRSLTDPIIQKQLFQSIELLKKYAQL
ncbi:MAG: hypothetical protein ACK5IC_05945 [Moheibacter sp.]